MAHRRCDCPSWLDEEACHEWRHLDDAGSVRRKDPETVAAYCFTLVLWTKVQSIVGQLPDKGSSSWTTRDGHRRPHPVVALEARLASDLLALTEALGLDPIGREARRPTRVLVLD